MKRLVLPTLALLTAVSACLAGETAPVFAASLNDGQRISGTLPAELTVTTRLGEFRVPVDRLESVALSEDKGKEQLEFRLMNGDILQGTVKGPFKLLATLGPELDLATAGLNGLQRATSSLHTPWSEPNNHLRARLRLLEAPSGRRGELTLLVELQNTGKETLRLLKPHLQSRVLAPRELGRQNGYNAWITAQFDGEDREQLHEAQELLQRGSRVPILPGGTYRLHITIPFETEGMKRLEAMEKLLEAIEEIQEPARERTHFFGTQTLWAQAGTGRFRVFYHVPEAEAEGGEKAKDQRIWSGSVVTPTLAIPFPVSRP